MNKKISKLKRKIIVSLIIFIIALVFHNNQYLSLILNIIAYLIVGNDILKKAFKNIANKQIFDEKFLMMIATFGAFVIREYHEAVMVMWFYQLGELFQSYAIGKSRESISSLMELCPDHANKMIDDKLVEVELEELRVDDVIYIKVGDKVPVDCEIIEGNSMLDTSSLTGESLLKDVKESDMILSGCINKGALLKARVIKEYDESTIAKILELVENAANKKAKTENFISKFAKYYTPIVTVSAILLVIIPTLFFKQDLVQYIKRACAFLVISCPCALVISIPLGFFGGIGGASKQGILIKGSNYIEVLAKVKKIVFDKTGTLTQGEFSITKIESKIAKEEFIKIAAHLESASSHPIASSIIKAYGNTIDYSSISDVEDILGKGIKANYQNQQYLVGNYDLLVENNINYPKVNDIGTIIFLVKEKEVLGYLIIADVEKDNAKETIQNLNKHNIETLMLTGDNENIAKVIANSLGINRYYANLLPNDKVVKIEELLSNKYKVAFVGDGINDAPVLMRADVGIGMGGLGSDAAIEASDIVIMDDNLEKINLAIKISKKTIRIVKENIIIALGIKFMVLLLGAFGLVSMWSAVFADVGVSILAILNSMRLLKGIK